MYGRGGSAISFTAPQRDIKSIEAEKAALSKEELETVTRDVSGQSQTNEESAESLEHGLDELERELADASGESAYGQAMKSCPQYANSVELRLMMLRSEKFDVKKAAKRMLKYWESRLSLFGEQLAFEPRPIRLSDLSDDDLATFRNGGMMMLPDKDRAGRAILLCRSQQLQYDHPANIARLLWYLIHVGLEDDEAQRNGIVLLALCFGPFDLFKHYDRNMERLCVRLFMESLPVRPASVHYGFDSPILEMLAPFQLFFFGREFRLRYTQHSGREGRENLAERLEGCGIAAEILPTSVGGLLQFDADQWLQTRRTKELVP